MTSSLKPTHIAKQFFIQGVTPSGKTFRPSDWAERLCGVMGCFQPCPGPHSHLAYSPYVQPLMMGGIKCVVVNEDLRDVEPMAYAFLMNFAKDNDLVVTEGCVIPTKS
jgi:hypothetical protein